MAEFIKNNACDPSPCSSSISTELDAFLKEISDESECFLQTLHVKVLSSFDEAEGDAENIYEIGREGLPTWPQFASSVPAQSYSDELLGPIQPDLKYFLRNDDDDDDMNNEWRRLGAAEENLRKELDLASCGFGLLGRSHSKADSRDTCYDELSRIQSSLWMNKSLLDDGDAASQHSAEHETVQKPRSELNQQSHKDESFESRNELSGDSYVLVPESKTPPITTRTYAFHTSTSLTEQACSIGLHRLPCDLGAFSCPIFRPPGCHNVSPFTSEEHIALRQNFCREFVNMMSSTTLRKLFVGLADVTQKSKSLHSADHQEAKGQIIDGPSTLNEEIAMLQHAIRTCTVRVRPDILCGSIMDSVTQAISTLDGEILKRQGGHLRAIIPSTYKLMKNLSFHTSSFRGSRTSMMDEMRLLPPWIMDAQVCTRKRSKECERVLLIRAFHVPPSLQTEIPPIPSPCGFGMEVEDRSKIDESTTSESSIPCIWDAAHILHDMILDKDIGDGFVTVEKKGEILPTSEAIV